jgi:hypothetical protein
MNAHAPQWLVSSVLNEDLIRQDALNLPALRLDVRRAVATAKIAEFENQSYRLGYVIRTGLLDRLAAADLLLNIATAHGLVREQGDDVIQSIIANGLALK